ncbi:hypothetical protein Ancab_015767 [Ancistrocladus abbreviatus]
MRKEQRNVYSGITECLVVVVVHLEGCSLTQACVEQCEKTGCVQDQCFPNCQFSADRKLLDSAWYAQEPLYLQWKEWNCRSDCRYHCMLLREEGRQKLGGKPIKYHGKWPLQRVLGIQEPVSVALSTLNLAVQFHGWLSFIILVYYKLPLRPNGKSYYEYTGLWHVYGILSMNSWFWSFIFHGRYLVLTERLYYSSHVAWVGFTLMLSILRSLNIRAEASRVMVAAPLIAFVITHLLFLNLVELEYVLNTVVVLVMVAVQYLFWAIWAGLSRHPSRWKMWAVIVGGILSILMAIYDFPPYKGFVDAHAFWQAIAVLLSYLRWSFVRDDAEFLTSTLINKLK